MSESATAVPPSELTVFGSWFDNHTDTLPKPFELPWQEFCEQLAGRFATREDKFDRNAPGFSLARFIERDGKVNRDKRHVDVLSGVVLDFDKNYDPEAVFAAVDGLTWLAYTTFTHSTEQPKWRLVIPFATPIPGPAYKSVRAWLLARIAAGKAGAQEADKAASSTANFYFGPGCPEAMACTEDCPEGCKEHAQWKMSDGPILELPPISSFKRGVPETRLLGDKIDWTWLKKKMETYHVVPIKRAFKAVLKGKPFAEKGGRDDTLLRMCGALAGWALQCDPHELASVFAPSLAAMEAEDPDDPPPDVENAADKIARSQSSLIAKSRDEVEMHVADGAAQEIDLTVPEGDEEQLDAIARERLRDHEGKLLPDGEATAEALRRRLLIQRTNSLWMFRADLGTWVGPYTDKECERSARLDLPMTPGASVHVRKVDGGIRMKTMAELFQDYGERADSICYSLEAQAAMYNPATRAFTLPGAPLRPLEPVFDEQVDAWLRALGGEKEDKLLDWIATITKHEFSSAILFLMGEQGVGKGLLTRGLARIWETDGATDMKNVAENFNALLLRCPLVFIDEGSWSIFVNATQVLRKMVAEVSRMVNDKYQTPVELKGSLRFIVTANGFDIFAHDAHALTPEARDAIALRFLEIQPKPEARDILLSIAPDERDALASENRIAQHALWLRDNRTVTPVGRFYVTGDKNGRFAFKIITEDRKWGSWTVEWLTRWLSDPMQINKEIGPTQFYLGEGRAIISPGAVVDTFERVLKNKRPPQSLDISDALRSLSTGKIVRFPNEKGAGFELLVHEVIAWAEEKGLGNPTNMRASINGESIARTGVVVRAPEKGKVLAMPGKGTNK